MLKKFGAITCVICLIMSMLVVPAGATAKFDAQKVTAAEELYQLGLFKGTGTNQDGTPIFDLHKSPTRGQAIIMLIRLLGKEEEALNTINANPFDDVSGTVEPYITYAYAHGLTQGKTTSHFGATDTVSASQYMTFVLRSLGYRTPDDFTVSTACQFADRIGLTHGEYANSTTMFTRGDVAYISRMAINHNITEQKQRPKLVQIKGKVYEWSLYNSPWFYEVSSYGQLPELYVNDYIEGPRVLRGDLRTDHGSEILNILNLAVGEYEISRTDNPYIDGTLELNTNDALRNKMNRTIKIAFETEYLSPTTSTHRARYTYNGVTLKQEDLLTDVMDGVVIENNGVHYCGNMRSTLIKVQDILKYFNIDKTISIGEYMGEPCVIVE